MNLIYSSLQSSLWRTNNTRDESINSEIDKNSKKEENYSIMISTSDLTIEQPINQFTVPKSSGLPKTRKRFSTKKLSTCNTCGHYRFAKRNKKNVVNEDYPYEHSSQGGCPVPMILHRCETDKLVRVCTCLACTKAASKFKSDLCFKKKPQQSGKIRSPMDEMSYSFQNAEYYNDPDDFEY
jgi:hypothetical protein